MYGDANFPEALAQGGRERAIDLHDMQVTQCRDERFGEGARTRTDLDHGVIALRVDRRDDARYVVPVSQEMLAKILARPWQHGHALARAACLAARTIASSMADFMLPESMLPVPARSSAVP